VEEELEQVVIVEVMEVMVLLSFVMQLMVQMVFHLALQEVQKQPLAVKQSTHLIQAVHLQWLSQRREAVILWLFSFNQ
jgi:hypothetical protein